MSKATTRIGIIRELIDRKALDFGFPPNEESFIRKMADSWKDHFDRANIPTSKLEDVYFEAMAGRDESSIFTPTTMIKAWQRLIQQENQQAKTGLVKHCSFCNDTGKFAYDKDGEGRVEMECPYH